MGATILVCTCGRRLRAAGVVPGKSGRCPGCGRTLRTPEAVSDEPTVVPAVEEDEWNWQGTYDVAPAEPPRPMSRAIDRADVKGPVGPWPDEPEALGEPTPPAEKADSEWSWQGTYDLGVSPPAPTSVQIPEESRGTVEETEANPPLTPRGRDARRDLDDAEPQRLDPWWPPRLLYPSRGVEGLGMVAAMGIAAWVMGTLASEYCLALLADGELMGTPSMGRLIALISALPVMILTPLVINYNLQYLSRVLEASSEGELLPPRPPDRNTNGLLDGVGSWLLWLVLGAGVGLLPLATYQLTAVSWSTGVAVALAPVGLPYDLMALLMTFLHDDALAARPWAVVGTIMRLGPSFLGLSLTIAALFALVGLAFAAVLALRERAFWVYILASLVCWMIAVWLPIVAMHTLGSYYAPRKGRLKWRRKRRRWGVN